MGIRNVSWFSCGAASAVATKLMLLEHPDTIPVRCVVRNEHADNSRFAADCAEWFGKPIVEIQSEKYQDCWEVWEDKNYIVGTAGAPCTTEMKKKPRLAFQREGDVQAFGFTNEEEDRAVQFNGNNIEVDSRFPLIEWNFSKKDCFEIISKAGIELPLMYRLGYKNANCIGCVKGGIGYWNKIRRDFPEVFWRMAWMELRIGATILKDRRGGVTKRLYLWQLDPEHGKHDDLDLGECSVFCSAEAA